MSAGHVVLLGDSILDNSDLLATPVSSTTRALTLFDERVTGFERDYRAPSPAC